MENGVKCFLFFNVVIAIVLADERLYFTDQDEKRWNTPPELTPEQIDLKSITNNQQGQSSLFPFLASPIYNARQSKAHSLSFGASEGEISSSQSSSYASNIVNHFRNSRTFLSSSQPSSHPGSRNDLPASNANTLTINRPVFGDNSETNTNASILVYATSYANGTGGNRRTTSNAQSPVGSTQSVATFETLYHIGGLKLSIQNTDRSSNSPQWTSNLRPNSENRDSSQPALIIKPTPIHWSEVNRPISAIRLEISSGDNHWLRQEPKIHISKWQPELEPDPADTRDS